MQSIHSLIPGHEILLSLEPEKLAGIVLEYFNSQVTTERKSERSGLQTSPTNDKHSVLMLRPFHLS